MKLKGIHFLLSYRCTDECDHCFLWGSPQARGTMTLAQIRDVLRQAQELGTVDMVYFEGGEPFLFYPIMIQGLREAASWASREASSPTATGPPLWRMPSSGCAPSPRSASTISACPATSSTARR